MTFFSDFWKTCKRQLTTRAVRRGLYSTALVALVLAIVIALNVLLSTLPTIYTAFDLTDRKQNESLSGTTKNYVSALSRDIFVYYLAVPGEEDARVARILERYGALSGRLHIETVNPELHPDFAPSMGIVEELAQGSFIVKSDLRAIAIPLSDYYIDVTTLSFAEGIVTYEGVEAFANAYDILIESFMAEPYNMTQAEAIKTMASMTYSEYKQAIDGKIPENILNLEAELTTAIDYVNLEELSTVYQIVGHGEAPLHDTLAGFVRGENVELKDLDLSAVTAVPEDCSAIVICAPGAEYTQAQLDLLKDYLQNGGHLILFSGEYIASPKLYDMLAATYGVSLLDGEVFDATRYTGNVAHVKPLLGDHSGIHNNFSANLNTLLFRAHALTSTPMAGVTQTPLLTSSADAWLRPTGSEVTDQSAQPSRGDLPGTYHYAIAIEQAQTNGASTQIVWFASPTIAGVYPPNYPNDLNELTSGGNFQYVLASILWNVERSGSLTMESAGMTYTPRLLVTSSEATVWLVCLAVLLPLAVIASGVVVTTKRRVR